jgi:uncharacterized glyoxalase superfamily protein PhnB
MKIKSFYPVLMTSDVKALRDFYCEYFGFMPTFEADWYVSLQKIQPEGVIELALLESGHATIPAGHRTEARGLILNFEVEDARREYERLVKQAKLEELMTLRDEEFGQRHFIVQDPAGNLIDIIENIAPGQAFTDNYVT